MKTQLYTLALIASLVSTGMLAGIFFTWTNAVTPGIGRLSDLEYLTAFKAMNRAILNPTFFVVFFLPLFSIPLSALLAPPVAGKLPGYLIAAALLHIAGCLCVTMFGNVPLNERLEQAPLETLTAGELKLLRSVMEENWNLQNLVRTIVTTGTFLLLISIQL